MTQAVPFHTSFSVLWPPLAPEYDPTALHEAGDRHETLARESMPTLPAGLGVASTTQRVPFQASASVAASGPLFPAPAFLSARAIQSPTAVQEVADVHETPS